MSWRKPVFTLGAVLACTSVLLAAQKPKAQPPTNPAALASPTAQARMATVNVTAATRLHAVVNGPREGGDTCADATVITALPFADTGNTCAFTDDYDEACPYTGSTSPDVVYEYTPTADIVVDISLCNDGTDYDTKLYVYEGGCPGTVVACNDDACSSPQFASYVSEVTGVALTGGTTYYIVVDGYGGSCGNYAITVNEGVPPPPGPECPADALFGQDATSPDGGWTAGTSEVNVNGSNYLRYEDFSGVTGQICDIHWWGLNLVNTGSWMGCTDSDPQFEIKFYEDNGGQPGAEVASYVVTPIQTLTGLQYAGFDLYSFDVPSLSPCVTLANGWVSIQGLGDADCWFLWMSSGETGSGLSYFDDGTGLQTQDFDLSLCLTGEYVPTFGACCDDATGDCQENVEMIDCLGSSQRFIENGTCADFDPPCGQIPGACCFTDADCQILTEDDCLAAGGDWLGANTDCSQCPVNCPPGYDQEQEPCGDDTNGGCNMATPTFEPVQCGTQLCGTGWFDGSTRDTDWFQIDVTEETEITMTVTPDFDALAGFVGQYVPGVPGCDNITGSVDPAMFPLAGETQSVTLCVGPGTYYLFVAPTFDTPVDCPALYLMTVDCVPCTLPRGACCLSDGSCVENTLESECGQMGGIAWYDGVGCDPDPCPTVPDNDDCANAEPVGDVTDLAFDTTFATFDGPGMCIVSGGNIWYCYTATCTGDATFSLCGSEFDTKIAVYDGCGCDTFNMLGCNDDSCGLQSELTVPVVAGNTYLVEIGGFGGDTGAGVLNISCGQGAMGACCVETDCIGDMQEADCIAAGGTWYEGESCDTFQCPEPLANDECVDAICVEDGQAVNSNNIDATGTDISSCAYNDFTDVWYMYTPTVDGDVTVSLCGSEFDTTLAIYDGCDGTELACNDDSCGLQSEITMAMTAGTTYYIRVAGYNGAMGNFTLLVTGGQGTCGCGDLDGDGDVDIDDYFAFLDAFGTCTGDPKFNADADFDGDGCITLVDYQMWVQCYRDANPGAPLMLPIQKTNGSVHKQGNMGHRGAMRK